jgi:DNA-binding transcriptional ArsR family regulator
VGKVDDVSPLKQWKHRTPEEVESDLAYLDINRGELLAALSEYLSSPRLTSKHADWCFLNVLIYAEYIATVSEIRKELMGIERYVKSLFPPKEKHITDISVFTRRPWHLPVALTALALSWAINPLAGIAGTAYMLVSQYRKRSTREQVNATFATMLQTYLSFNTIDLSWAHVASTLKRSREAGVICDASLYALAERRMGNQGLPEDNG